MVNMFTFRRSGLRDNHAPVWADDAYGRNGFTQIYVDAFSGRSPMGISVMECVSRNLRLASGNHLQQVDQRMKRFAHELEDE